MFLGNNNPISATLTATTENVSISVQKAIQILGVYLTYDQVLWKKLNFEEILKIYKRKVTLLELEKPNGSWTHTNHKKQFKYT